MPSKMKLYQVVGRKSPTATDANPTAYRMKIFAPNTVMAESRFWYFMHQMRKMKKTTGEILDVNEIVEKNSRYIKNFGIWLKYNTRSGTSNMYREYRHTELTGAIDMMYQDMAGRHRTRAGSLQILGTAAIADKDCKRDTTQEYHTHENPKEGPTQLRFPLPHRIQRAPTKAHGSTFLAKRPQTHFQ